MLNKNVNRSLLALIVGGLLVAVWISTYFLSDVLVKDDGISNEISVAEVEEPWEEIITWAEREEFDAIFDRSNNSTLMFKSKECSCGADQSEYRQSYTDAEMGASAVRECPQGTFGEKDNQVTERYATSIYCLNCGRKELSFDSEDIWIYRTNGIEKPHYHVEIPADAEYWCKSFIDYYGQKWLYIYSLQEQEEKLLDKVKVKEDDSIMQVFVTTLSDDFDV